MIRKADPMVIRNKNYLASPCSVNVANGGITPSACTVASIPQSR